MADKHIKSSNFDRPLLAVAPMMDWTDRHCRYFHRQISGCALLYTEMVTAPALVRGGALHLLDHDVMEHPVALQLGGSDPRDLAQAARIGARTGYDQIDLNCGCPSDRVQSGTFGAVLMKDPALVARCVAEMQAAVDIPVTVKCRIGVDDQTPEEVLPEFLARIIAAGCERVTIHARKAWLQGLSPKENRQIPPLDHDLVHRMKMLFPHLHISINGGISDQATVARLLETGLDGVMVGRAAYHQPWDILGGADEAIWTRTSPNATRQEVAQAMLPYIERHLSEGGRLHQVTRHMLGLFAGLPGARGWRRMLSEGAVRKGAGPEIVQHALDHVQAARTA